MPDVAYSVTRPILRLPVEILLGVLGHLSVAALTNLSSTCWTFYSFVETYWSTYIRANPRQTRSLRRYIETLTPKQQAKYYHLSDCTWSHREGRVREIVPPPPRGTEPAAVMAVSPSRLLLFSGISITSMAFDISPSVKQEAVGHLRRERPAEHTAVEFGHILPPDVTGAQFLPDGGLDETLAMSTADGGLFRARYSTFTSRQRRGAEIVLTETARYPHPNLRIACLGSSDNTLATVAVRNSDGIANGLLSVYSVRSPWIPPSRLLLPGKPECILLSTNGSTPYVAVGSRRKRSNSTDSRDWDNRPDPSFQKTSSYIPSAPLMVHAIDNSGLRSTAIAHLSASSHIHSTNAPYALAAPPPESPFGDNPNIILSGWYSSVVHVHDLRHRHPTPILSLRDKWTDSAVYSLGMGGGSGAHVVAGMASHGIVEIYDVRNPRSGYGVYTPGKASSSVRSLQVEASRVWGITNRLFMLDMGPDAQGNDIAAMRWCHDHPSNGMQRM